jgi:hypothetical protein
MLRVFLAVCTLWLAQLALAVVENPLERLVPIPRHVWDTELIAKRAGDLNSSVGLQDHEQVMWTSSNSK